jgi:hypothetical protein
VAAPDRAASRTWHSLIALQTQTTMRSPSRLRIALAELRTARKRNETRSHLLAA